MKVIIAPDKFKGSLTSFEVCKAIASGIRAVDPAVGVLEFPMADGGDGFAAVMRYYLHTTTVSCPTQDPLGRPMTASYEFSGDTAIIEMASASGLELLKPEERNVLKTSTKGTGIVMRDAIARGARRIILGLGGSATNDAGTGILAALDFQLVDEGGGLVEACGENLIHIHAIHPPAKLPEVRFEIACDVQNVLYGPQGAAYVYAPQKGATPQDVVLLDDGLRHFAGLLKKEVADVPGAGAAGGIAAGLMGFFDVRLRKGIDMVIALSGIRDVLSTANVVITGEGKIDTQTLYGKVVSEIAALAAEQAVPAVAFCGVSVIPDMEVKQLGLQSIQAIMSAGVSREEAMIHADRLLQDKAAEWFGTRHGHPAEDEKTRY